LAKVQNNKGSKVNWQFATKMQGNYSVPLFLTYFSATFNADNFHLLTINSSVPVLTVKRKM
jgi:hypothetical protein